MSSYDTAVEQPAVARDQSHALFGQTMGLVAITTALFALGAYLGRDLSYGWGLAAYILSRGLAKAGSHDDHWDIRDPETWRNDPRREGR